MPTARTEIMERMRTAFRAEALDLLPELDAALLAMELDPGNAALVNRVFRAMHTIKGSGATAGFTHLAHFAHRVEEAFDLARANKLPITSTLIDCGLKACDVIREILDMDDEDREAPGERAVTEAVARLLPSAQPGLHVAEVATPKTNVLSAFRILFRPHPDLFRSGTDPVSLLDELRDLGTSNLTAHTTELPHFSLLDSESCYLWWEVLLLSECGEAAIRDVFLFVEDDCRIEIELLPHQEESIAFLLLSKHERETQLSRLAATYVDCLSSAIPRMRATFNAVEQHLPDCLQLSHSLAVAAMCEQRTEILEAVHHGSRILGRVSRVARALSSQDCKRLLNRVGTMRLHATSMHPKMHMEDFACV